MLTFDETLRHIRLAKSGDEKSKEILIKNNSLLIKSIVQRFLGKNVEYDDLFQLGSIGLLKAINNFDEKFGVKFSTYAVPMIIGEIKRYLRDDGEIKVSRIIKMQAREINKFAESYEIKHGKSPDIAAISAALKIPEEDVILALDSSKMPVSLYTSVDDGEDKGQSLIDKIPSKFSFDEHIDSLYLKNLLSTLNERERKLIILRYFRDKTQGEVAEILGVSQVQVSRLENKILTRLKEKA